MPDAFKCTGNVTPTYDFPNIHAAGAPCCLCAWSSALIGEDYAAFGQAANYITELTNNNTQCPDNGALGLLTPDYSHFCESVSHEETGSSYSRTEQTSGCQRSPGAANGRLHFRNNTPIKGARRKDYVSLKSFLCPPQLIKGLGAYLFCFISHYSFPASSK